MGRREDFLRAAKQAADNAKSTAGRGATAAGGAIGRGREAVGATVQSGRDIGDAAVAKGTEVASAAVGKATALSADFARSAALLVPQRLEAIGSPTLPLTAPWGTGFGNFLSGIAGVPSVAGPVLARLDQFGSVAVSPTSLEFDGEVLEWRNIQAVTLGSPVDAISSKAALESVQRLRTLLPAFPGRTLLVRHAVELLIALCLAVVQPTSGRGDEEPVPVVTSIRYAGRLRRREIRPSFFAILLCAMKPTLTTAAVDMSRPHGAAITLDPPSRAVARAAAVRDLALQLRRQIGQGDSETSADRLEGKSIDIKTEIAP